MCPGYDNGVIGGLLTAPDFIARFGLSASMQGTVTSLFEVGCSIGCLASSLSGNRFGRLSYIHVGSFVICLGAVIQASSYSVAQLIVGRIVAGVGLGFITSNVTVWQAETAPRHARGLVVCCSLSLLIVGSVSAELSLPRRRLELICVQLLAYWLDYAMNYYTTGVSWRFPMAFQAFIALLMSLMLFFMPECKRPVTENSLLDTRC